MRSILSLLLLLFIPAITFAQGSLTPLDFGLKLREHGQIDYQHTPPNVLVGNFNNDCYPDLARYNGNKLEVYICQGQGYTATPQGEKTYSQPIKGLALSGNPYFPLRGLLVTLQDGTRDTLRNQGGRFDLRSAERFLMPTKRVPPRSISDADLQLVWESEGKPFGMYPCVAGDLDSDGHNELVTWWKEDILSDSAWILIYKSVGNDQYVLSLEAPFSLLGYPNQPLITFLLITDLDGNGQKELIYTCDRIYVWEFTSPGQYAQWNTDWVVEGAILDMQVCDVDQDSHLELAFVAEGNPPVPPWLSYYCIREFATKYFEPDSIYHFTSISTIYQNDWNDGRLAVGDFDNDGVVDIVAGNGGFVWGYNPIDMHYYRFAPALPNNFEFRWLQTGLPLSCVTPIIGDLDEDGLNELFAGGLYPHGGSAFLWKTPSAGHGYAAWVDTTNLNFGGPNWASSGLFDNKPAVSMTVNQEPTGYLTLFGNQEISFTWLWTEIMPESTFCWKPSFLDMDQDGKMNLCITGGRLIPNDNIVIDYEQIASGGIKVGNDAVPERLHMDSPWPNPFNANLNIPYEIKMISDISFTVFDPTGRRIYTKTERNILPGKHRFNWRANGVSTGLYFVALSERNNTQFKKVILLK